MSTWSLSLSLVIAWLQVLALSGLLVRDWEYTLDRFLWNSTNEDMVTTYLQPVRIRPGVYAMNGTFGLTKDINGYEYKIKIAIERSPTGSSHYIRTPYNVNECTLYHVMSTVYKTYLMKDLNKCAGLQIIDEDWDGIIKADNYVMNECILKLDSWPPHMEPGLYRAIVDISGPQVRYVAVILLRIISKL